MGRIATTVVILGCAAILYGQAPAPVQNAPVFEVASVRVNRSEALGSHLRLQPNGGLTAVNEPLRELIQFAYSLPAERIQGLPDWAHTAGYDVATTAGSDKTSQEPTPTRSALMLRSLLAERFKLKAHNETRQLPVYELRRASDSKLGPRLSASERNCRTFQQSSVQANELPCGLRVGIDNGSVRGGGVSLGEFAEALGRILQRPTVDRTGLVGNFDVEITFNPESLPQPLLPPGESPGSVLPRTNANAPSVFTAVQEQLELRLESARGAVEVLVIESVERPTPD